MGRETCNTALPVEKSSDHWHRFSVNIFPSLALATNCYFQKKAPIIIGGFLICCTLLSNYHGICEPAAISFVHSPSFPNLYHNGKPTLLLFDCSSHLPIAIGAQLNSQFGVKKLWTVVCPWSRCSQGTGARQRDRGWWKFDQLERDLDKHGARGGKNTRVNVQPPWQVPRQPPSPLDPRIPASPDHHIRRYNCQPSQITSENVSFYCHLSTFSIYPV